MSIADKIFKQVSHEIIYLGYNTDEDDEVRSKWHDGAPAYSSYVTPVINRYDLRDEFPLMTLRRTALKSAVDEVLWIFQKKSNNIHDLNSHIWDQWADESGSIGKAYGYQIGKKYLHHKVKGDVILELSGWDLYPSVEFKAKDGYTEVWLDQMDAVLYDLRENPTSRRIMTNTYCFDDLSEMGLYPCAYSTTWNVAGNTLNLILNQRSQDMLAASNWNVAQYAALLIMVARATGYTPGVLTHVIANCHIYDRHIPIVEELINREEFDAPKVTFTNNSINFYDYKPEDFVVEDYKYGEQVKFEVAI